MTVGRHSAVTRWPPRRWIKNRERRRERVPPPCEDNRYSDVSGFTGSWGNPGRANIWFKDGSSASLTHTHSHTRYLGGLNSPSTRLHPTCSSQLITEQNRCQEQREALQACGVKEEEEKGRRDGTGGENVDECVLCKVNGGLRASESGMCLFCRVLVSRYKIN